MSTFTADRPRLCESCESCAPARRTPIWGWVCTRCHGYLSVGREVPPIGAPPAPRPAPTLPPESSCRAAVPSRPIAPSPVSSPVAAAPTMRPVAPPMTARPAARAWGRGAAATKTAAAPRGDRPVALATVTAPPPPEPEQTTRAQVVALLRAEPGLATGQVARRLGVSPATARRLIAAARSAGELPPDDRVSLAARAAVIIATAATPLTGAELAARMGCSVREAYSAITSLRRRRDRPAVKLSRPPPGRPLAERIVKIARADPTKLNAEIAAEAGACCTHVSTVLTAARADGRLPPRAPGLAERVLVLLRADPTLKARQIATRIDSTTENVCKAIARLRARGVTWDAPPPPPPAPAPVIDRDRVLAFARATPGLSPTEIGAALGIRGTAVAQHVSRLRRAGLILPLDPARPGTWAAPLE